MSNVTTSNVPNKALAKTNMELYKSGMLDAATKGMNTTFMVCISLTVAALVMTLFLKEKTNAIIPNLYKYIPKDVPLQIL